MAKTGLSGLLTFARSGAPLCYLRQTPLDWAGDDQTSAQSPRPAFDSCSATSSSAGAFEALRPLCLLCPLQRRPGLQSEAPNGRGINVALQYEGQPQLTLREKGQGSLAARLRSLQAGKPFARIGVNASV